jgi:folate-dependent phosphoribosylglycinamide formyltransferase PurN
VALESSDNPESIENKVRSLELKHYPQEIKNFIESL